MPMDIVGWALAAAVVGGVVVFVVMARGRRALQEQASSAQSARAVADARLNDLTAVHAQLSAVHGKLSQENLSISTDRQRLSTSLEKVALDLQRETAATAALRDSLDKGIAAHTKLDSEYRVAKSQTESLAARVSQLDEALRTADAENRRQGEAIAQLRAGSAALEQARNDLLARLAEQKTWVEEQTRFFEEKITTATTKLMEEKSRAFTEVNKKEMDAVVTPFREQLKEFRERVDNIYATENRERGQLHEQIQQLTSLNQTVSQQAEALTRALTISSKATGDWGEMILHKILEASGLREGHEYVLQHTVTAGDEDAVQRPDAVIFLPDGKQVVVDSKVSNKAWKDYCAADDASREEKLAEHLAALRAHIRELSARDYPRSPDLKTIDFVLMFVPVEAALLTALSHDDTLFGDAWRSKIYLVSPGMLMASLKLIEGMWVYQRRKESADKIAEAGRKLYEKLTTFANTFVEIGAAIDKAHGTFEKAQAQLATGKGNTIRLAQKMVEYGVRPAPGRVMPAELVQLAAEEEDSEDEELAALPAPEAASAENKGDEE